MAKLSIKPGSTSVSQDIFIADSSVTTGAGKTGLAYNTASLVAYYHRPLSSPVAITLATQTVTGAYSSGGFVEVDATNMPGLYRLDIPDAAFAVGARCVTVMLKGATNMVPVPLEIDLNAEVNLTHAAATAVTLDANNVLNVSSKYWAGTAITATSIPVATAAGAAGGLFIAGTNSATSVSITGNITGNLSGSVGSVTARVTANSDQLAGQTITAAAGVTFPTSVASPTNITAGTITTVTNLTNAPTAGDLTATMKTSVTTAATAATPTAAAVTAGVTVTTNNDKTGYALTQAFPANFSALAVTVGGAVTAGTVSDKTGYSISGTKTTLDALNDITAASVWTSTLTESYAANHAAFTGAQAMYQLWAAVSQFSIAGTTITAQKIDGTTTAMTYTISDATNPTSRVRAT